jgi:hypothetical protein
MGDVSNRERLFKFSPFLSIDSLSPAFYFSYHRRPILKKTRYRSWEVEDEEELNITFLTTPLKMKFHFLDYFFLSYKKQPNNLFSKNITLSLLKKKNQSFPLLTKTEKALKLTYFTITEDLCD